MHFFRTKLCCQPLHRLHCAGNHQHGKFWPDSVQSVLKYHYEAVDYGCALGYNVHSLSEGKLCYAFGFGWLHGRIGLRTSWILLTFTACVSVHVICHVVRYCIMLTLAPYCNALLAGGRYLHEAGDLVGRGVVGDIAAEAAVPVAAAGDVGDALGVVAHLRRAWEHTLWSALFRSEGQLAIQ